MVSTTNFFFGIVFELRVYYELLYDLRTGTLILLLLPRSITVAKRSRDMTSRVGYDIFFPSRIPYLSL